MSVSPPYHIIVTVLPLFYINLLYTNKKSPTAMSGIIQIHTCSKAVFNCISIDNQARYAICERKIFFLEFFIHEWVKDPLLCVPRSLEVCLPNSFIYHDIFIANVKNLLSFLYIKQLVYVQASPHYSKLLRIQMLSY